MGTDNGWGWFLVFGIAAIALIVWLFISLGHKPTSDGYGIPTMTTGDPP